MVQSIPAPLNPLSVAAASYTDNNKAAFASDGRLPTPTVTATAASADSFLQQSVDGQTLDEELFLSWLGDTSFDETTSVDRADVETPKMTSMSSLDYYSPQELPLTMTTATFAVPPAMARPMTAEDDEEVDDRVAAAPKALSDFLESISAGWKQHAINTSTAVDSSSYTLPVAAATATATVAAAYCVPFTLLDEEREQRDGDGDGHETAKGTSSMVEEESLLLPIAVADSSDPVDGGGGGGAMKMKGPVTIPVPLPPLQQLSLPLPLPTPLKRIRSLESHKSDSSGENDRNSPRLEGTARSEAGKSGTRVRREGLSASTGSAAGERMSTLVPFHFLSAPRCCGNTHGKVEL
jgi:hypothetical protein